MNNKNFDILDLLNILSLGISMENLEENRQQSKYNDIHSANDNQTNLILQSLDKKFKEQNELLYRILDILENN